MTIESSQSRNLIAQSFDIHIAGVRMCERSGAGNPGAPWTVRNMRGGYGRNCTKGACNDSVTGLAGRNCRSHGLSNLHLGGFRACAPAGHADPACTIIHPANRLAAALQRAPFKAGKRT
jgi:hypothetical protein